MARETIRKRTAKKLDGIHGRVFKRLCQVQIEDKLGNVFKERVS